MTKYLLMSVRSEWVYHILNGDKTIELRKVIPNWALESVKKGETVKCLIYCTKAKPYLSTELQLFNIPQFDDRLDLNGKIVAEFDLKTIGKITIELNKDPYTSELDYNAFTSEWLFYEILARALVGEEEFENYGPKYAMYIKNLKTFDEPKNLSDYMNNFYQSGDTVIENKPITRAPQNMMTVWGIDE